MNEKLQKVCEEILQNETESKKFKELKTPEEMYAYFKEKVPNLSEEEFDSFIAEILEQYSDEQENSSKNVSDSLGKVAGGVMLNKLSKKMLSGVLALTSLLPVAASATNTKSDHNASSFSAFDEEFDGEYEAHSKSNGTFKKITNWIKNHKLLITGVTLAGIVATVLTVRHFRNKPEKEGTKSLSSVGDIAKDKLKEKIKAAKNENDIYDALEDYLKEVCFKLDQEFVDLINFYNEKFEIENFPTDGQLNEISSIEEAMTKDFGITFKLKGAPPSKEELMKISSPLLEALQNVQIVISQAFFGAIQEKPKLNDIFKNSEIDAKRFEDMGANVMLHTLNGKKYMVLSAALQKQFSKPSK